MPYHWLTETGEAPDFSGVSYFDKGDPPLGRLELTAHNSLTPRGFVIFIALTFALICVPLMAVAGSPVLWALLPFMLAALGMIWWALQRSWSDKSVRETMAIWSDRLELVHLPGRGAQKSWTANTHWATVHIHARRGQHRQYITLTGDGAAREVELGSFLTEAERRLLYPELVRAIRDAAQHLPQQ